MASSRPWAAAQPSRSRFKKLGLNRALWGVNWPHYRPPRKATNAPAQSPAIEEPAGALTLRQALALALARNPDLAVFSWDVRLGEARML